MIWRDPRGTIRYIVDINPNRGLMVLAVLGALGNALGSAANFGMRAMLSTSAVISLCFIAGPVSGFIRIFLWSRLLSLVTLLGGGVANTQKLRAAVARAPVAQ